MSVDLSLLLPEIAILVLVSSLTFLEMFLPEIAKRFRMPLNLLGVLVVALAVATLVRRTETLFYGMFSVDSFSVFFKFLFLGTAACVFIMKESDGSLSDANEFSLILWSALLGMFFLVSSKDFLLLFISLELFTLSMYILTAYTRRNRLSIEAGLKYLILGSLASAFLLYGISLIYASTGTLSFDTLHMMSKEGETESWLFLVGVLFVLSGLGFKVASVPFQVWVPDVYQGAPTPVVAFLSVASKSAGFAVLLRILFQALGAFDHERRILFTVLASMTLLYGNLGALVQKDMKRLLGFSAIGHVGYLLIALAADGSFAGRSLLYYLIAYALTNLTAFIVVSIVENSDPNRNTAIDAFSGLFKRSPFLASAMFLSLLSLAGIPPLAGFFAKFLILLSAANSKLIGLVILGALNVAISLYYYLSIVRVILFEKISNQASVSVKLPLMILLSGLMIGMVMVGIWQFPFLAITSSAIQGLLS